MLRGIVNAMAGSVTGEQHAEPARQGTNTGQRSKEHRWVLAAFGAALLLFVGMRIVLQFGLTPFLDQDTYKYLGGADALWAGRDLPPLFRDLDVTGGALHAVPAYAWFVEWIWAICGGTTLRSVLIVQSFFALIGYLAAADLVRRWVGRWPGVAVFAVLALAPPLGWLEHLVMPDVLAAPLFFSGAWLVVVAPLGSRFGWRSAVNGAICGLILGFAVLLRTASQFYLPILLAVAWSTRHRVTSFSGWALGFVAGAALAMMPWALQNQAHHGVYRVSASTGRNLYFSALWSNTVDRARRVRELGLKMAPTVPSSFEISDSTLRGLLHEGRSFAEADAEMGRMALAAYGAKPLRVVIAERYELLKSLFVPSSDAGISLVPLRRNADRLLSNTSDHAVLRRWAEQRFKYQFSKELVEEMERARRVPGVAGDLFRVWVWVFTVDGLPLLVAYLLSLPGLLLLPRLRGPVFWTLAAPPLGFLAVFLVVGAPLYRYQAALHPYMLATVVVGASVALRHSRLRRSRSAVTL